MLAVGVLRLTVTLRGHQFMAVGRSSPRYLRWVWILAHPSRVVKYTKHTASRPSGKSNPISR